MASIRFATGLLLASTAAAQLQQPYVPTENPQTPEKVILGKILFWEEQLSSDDSVACGTCHLPEFGGADPRSANAIHPGPDRIPNTADDIHGSPGLVRQDAAGDFAIDGVFGLRAQVTGRIANSNIGAAYHAELFWDGRAGSRFLDPETGAIAISFGGALENQAVGPILSPVEMGKEGRTWDDVRNKLLRVSPLQLARNLTPDIASTLGNGATYPDLFRAAFGDPAINARRIAFAIASYQRTLLPDQTPYDSFLAGNGAALTPSQLAGLQVFEGSGRCNACHPAPFFSDDLWHNLGLRPAREDEGHGNVSGVSIDSGTFKTPSLRNVSLRPRLFHNGSSPGTNSPDQLTDPDSMVNVYLNGGGVDRSNLDPFLLPLRNLNVSQIDMLNVLAFLDALTDPRVAQALPPFDHPTLRSMDVAPPVRFGASVAGASEPQIVDTTPAWLGNADWKLGLAGGSGNALAYLGWSLAARSPGVHAAGVPIHIGPHVDGQFLWLNNTAGMPGIDTFRLGIPNEPVLRDLTIYLQLFVSDQAAPTGFATSRGHGITLAN